MFGKKKYYGKYVNQLISGRRIRNGNRTLQNKRNHNANYKKKKEKIPFLFQVL